MAKLHRKSFLKPASTKVELAKNDSLKIESIDSEPVAIFRCGKLWHTIESLDAAKGEYVLWEKLKPTSEEKDAGYTKVEIAFRKVPTPITIEQD
jgi:hypothetical protein